MVAAMTSGSLLSFAAPLVEEIAVRAPRFQSCLHRRRGDGLIEEAQRSLIGLQLSSHERSPRHWPPVARSPREQGICEVGE
jgi:hypothetical protein